MTSSLLLSLALSLSPSAHADDSAGWPDISTPPAAGSSSEGARDAALVIAIGDYDHAQDLPGAVANGRAWVRWLKEVRGARTIKVLEDGTATREEILLAAQGLRERIEPGSRVWIIYIGHGAPSGKGDGGLLVGVDARQNAVSLEARSVRLEELQAALDGPQAEVVLVQDACFSGKTSGGDLAPGLAPLKAVKTSLGPTWTVLSAGRNDEYAGPLSDGTRPAFSYLVLGALRGWGDGDRDGQVSAREAVDYANDALYATVTGRTQRPELTGSDVELGRSAREGGPDLTALGMGSGSSGGTGPNAVAGQVQVELGGDSTDFAALAAQAEAAKQARENADRLAREAEAALEGERRRRIDEAKAKVKEDAARDFAAIEGLLSEPTEEARPILIAWLERYGEVKVTIDGATETIEVPEAARVHRALGTISYTPTRFGEEWTGASGYTMVSVLPGSYTRWENGPPHDTSNYYPSNRPAEVDKGQVVTLTKGFWMGRTEVTQALWKQVTGNNTPSARDAGGRPMLGDSLPVVQVTWCEAASFANKLSALEGLDHAYSGTEECMDTLGQSVLWDQNANGYRLPTAAEWEYAAQGGLEWGDFPFCSYANFGDPFGDRPCPLDKHELLAPVGSYRSSAWGLFDMAGNVSEHCWDQGSEHLSLGTDPIGPSGDDPSFKPNERVMTRSSFDSPPDVAILTALGFQIGPDHHVSAAGLRLVRTIQ